MRQTLFVLFTILTFGLSAQSTFTVTNINDSGPGSLRQAITDANTNGDELDVINFYLSESGSKTILLNSQLPLVTTALTINGPGEEVLAISGQNAYRILFINSTGDVTISDITLKQGRARGGNGQNKWNPGGGGAGMGGAIFHQAGNLDLNFVSLESNSAIGGNGGTLAYSHGDGANGGAGPFGGTTATQGNGANGIFGAGGAGPELTFQGESPLNGGNGGYGAGGGGGSGATGGVESGNGGNGGKFGGNGSTAFWSYGGGGAGLGAALFVYGGSIDLNTVKLINNTATRGNLGSGGSSSGAENGQAKAAGIFHYQGTVNTNGIFFHNNTAGNALNTPSDNANFYSETGLTLTDSNAPTIARSTPEDGESNIQRSEGIIITFNENVFMADGSAILNTDLPSLLTFKETNASGADVAFTATINLNKISIEPTNSLTNGATYYIGISGIEDRNGNELTTPETITFTLDGAAPVFTADPPSGSTLIGRSFTFTADEDIYNTDGSDIDPSELINIAKVRLDNALGAIVSTSATKVGNAIQISLDQALPEQIYHVTFENIADANGNVTAPQVFTYTRPAFADAKIRVNPSTGNELATRAIEVTFDEEYYVEVSTGSFSLFNTRTYSQAYTDAVLDLKLNDENGTDIIDRWSFDADGKLYILNDLAPSSTYYLQIANLFTADQKPVEALEMTFTTPDTFNPVKGSGYAASFNSGYTDQNESLGITYSAEFAIKIDGSTRYKQALFWGYSPSNTEKMVFWLNDDKLTLSKVDASNNVVSDQSIESSVITGFDSYQEVGFTYDNGSIVLYHNGVAVGSGTIDFDNYKLTALGLPSPGSITGSFGTVNFSERFFLFTDEIRIWNTALTAQTILDGINTPITTSHAQFADLKHLWTFDENGGKFGYDAKTGIANLCFSCAGTTPRWEASNRRDEPLIEIALGGEMLAVGDEISFLAGNGGQLQKTLTITNTGSLPLELLGEAYVADFEGRFTIDYSDTETTIAPGASTNFMITFQSNDVRTYNTSLTIPNNSLDNSFELSLKGSGISATSGNWQTYGTPGELPQIYDMWAHDGKLTITAELVEAPYTRFVVDVTENAGGGLSYSTPTYLSNTVIYGNYFFDLIGDGVGNYYVNNQYNIGEIKNLITNEIQTYGMNTTHDDFTDGELKTDRNGVIHYLHSFYDGAATNSYGLKIEKGHPATETITLTFEDLVNFGGTINNGTEILAYSMAFDSNNDLYVTLTTNESNPEPRQYILKYNSTTGWDDFGYDSFSAPYRSNVYGSSYNELIIDENDFLHIGTMNSPTLRYQKFTPDGILIEGGELWNNTLGLYYPGVGTSLDRNRFFGLGAAGEPMFISKTNNSGISSVVYEAGGFSLFNEQYITGSDPGYFPGFFCSIDQQTGQPYIVKNGSGNNSAYTMQGISPELSVAVDGHALQRETTFPLQIGVGTAYEFDMTISNSGFTNLHLKGDPLLTFAGDKAADLSYETEGLPSILKIGESVTIPITFAPKTIYTKSELVVNLPTNSPNGDFEFSILLSSLDNTNTGEWALHTDVIDPPYNDVDMRIGNFNQPNYTYNTYQEVTYTTGPNAGTTIPYARLESYDVFKGAISFDPDILDENVSLPTAFPLPHYFRRIQVASSPMNQINYFAHEYKQSGTFYKGLFSANPASGKTPVGSAESSARMDYEFGSDGTRYELYANPNGLFTVRNAGEFTLNFTGQSISSEDLDLEVTDDFAYAIRQYNSRAWVYKAALGANATDPASVTIFDTGDNGMHIGNVGIESHTKDLEVFGDKLYIAFVNPAKEISLYVHETTTTQLPSPSVTNVIDLQLQIHPDGTPYISYIEDLASGQFPVSVIKLVDGVWETVGTPRFSYGDYDTEYTVAGDQPIRPALRAPFQINDLGELFVFYGDIYSIIEEPATFNHLPVFTSTPVASVNEGESYFYEITATDIDLDLLTISSSDLPDWLTIFDNGDGTAYLTGTPQDEEVAEYIISLSVSDGKLNVTQEVTLEVMNVNEAPVFLIVDEVNTYDESDLTGSINITDINDNDISLEELLSFDVTLDNTDIINFALVSHNQGEETGTLVFNHVPNTSGVVNITVRLEDESGFNFEQTIQCNFVAGGVFLSSNVIDEHAPIGTVVGEFTAIDVNDDEIYTFSLVSGDGSDNNDLFTIVGNSLQSAGEINFESILEPTIRVAADNGEGTIYEDSFVITVNDLNDAPTDILLSESTIDEGAEVGSVIGTLTAEDEDNGTYTFSLADGFGDNASFQIVGNELQVAEVFDFDVKSGYSIQVELDDSGVILTRDYTITVNNINVAPTAITLSNNTTPENGFADVLIGTLSTVDTDDEDTHTYSIVGGTTSLENDDVKLIGNELYTNRSFDFETEPEILVEIRSTDNGQESVTQTLTITIEDANEVPTGIELSANTVEENVEVGFVISTVSVLDPDINDQHTLTLVQGYEQNYVVSIDGLNIMSAIPLDYETLSSLALQLLVEDAAGGLNQFEVVIDVMDLNEAPTDIFATNTSIDENAQYGTVIGSLSAVDQDEDNTHTFRVLNFTEVDGVKTYDVLAQNGNLIVGNTIDFETTQSLTIDVEAFDQNGLSFVKTFDITINNVNERPERPVLSNAIIQENVPVGTVVGFLSANDPDADDIITFSINPEYLSGAMFELVGNELRTAVPMDFEFQNNPIVELGATDQGGLDYTTTFQITVTDINEAPTAITLSKSDIDEDAPVGSVIGALSTADQDVDDTHTYEVLTPFTVNGQTFFPIVADGANLITTVPLDFETIPTFVIEVRSTDAGGLSFIETFTLSANDVNEAPTSMTLNANTIAENSAAGLRIGQLVGTDPDFDTPLTYALVAGAGDEGNASFQIGGPGNELQSAVIFDFETQATYSVRVRVTDPDGLFFEQVYSIEVTDTNDSPTGIELSSLEIAENSEVGTVVGSFTAIDKDAIDEHTFILHVNYPDKQFFTIDGSELKVGANIDFESAQTLTIGVVVNDADGGNSFTKEFVINVIDVSEGSPQTITFEALATKTFGDAPFELTATASSNLPVVYTSSNEALVSISGSTATILGAGEVTLTATQAGNETFDAASATQVLTISKAAQTITFDALADRVSGSDPIDLVATASSNLSVSFEVSGPASLSGTTLTISGIGEVSIIASQPGNENYLAATSVTRVFNVTDPAKSDQVITFDPPATVYVTDASLTLIATTTSNLTLTYEIVSGSTLASLSGNALSFLKAGTVEIKVSQAGDATFNAASVVKSIVIKPVFKVSGNVTNETGGAFTAGTVMLLRANQTAGTITTLDASGNYQFNDIKDGIYYVGVVPNDESAYYITAYGNAVIYQNATPLNLSADASGINIQMVAKASGNELTGDGEVTGRVIEDDGAGNRIAMGRILEGTPIEGASIFLVRKSDDKILTEVFSDANGDFTISGIPEGSFSILINIPGVEGTVSSDITVKKGTKVLMTAMVGEEGIVFESEVTEALGLDELGTAWKVYPNPVVDVLKLEFEAKVTSLNWSLISLMGQEIKRGVLEETTSGELYLGDISNGIYFLILTDQYGYSKQIKISK